MDIVRWTSYGGHRMLDIVRRTSYGGHRTVGWTLYVVRRTMDIVCWTLYVGHRTLDIVRWTAYVGHRTLDIVRWTSTVTTRERGVRWFSEPTLPLPAKGRAGRQMVRFILFDLILSICRDSVKRKTLVTLCLFATLSGAACRRRR